jgi:uncharacterized OsmC-like protein
VERAKIAFPQTKERSSMMADLNKGFNMDSYNKFKSRAQENPKVADRDKTAVAYWVQGEEARVVLGDKEVTIGADAGMNMMEMLLSSYAACDAAMVALHASFMDLKVERLKVEVSGHFNVAAYLGIEDAPGAGYDQISVKSNSRICTTSVKPARRWATRSLGSCPPSWKLSPPCPNSEHAA